MSHSFKFQLIYLNTKNWQYVEIIKCHLVVRPLKSLRTPALGWYKQLHSHTKKTREITERYILISRCVDKQKTYSNHSANFICCLISSSDNSPRLEKVTFYEGFIGCLFVTNLLYIMLQGSSHTHSGFFCGCFLLMSIILEFVIFLVPCS